MHNERLCRFTNPMYVSELEAKLEAAERRAAELEAAEAEAAPAPATASTNGTHATSTSAAWAPQNVHCTRHIVRLGYCECEVCCSAWSARAG